ncbi:hypothetical protein BABINDRAFT_9873 [Babjeviella inositovora NRRL Y-12698]|uniref:Uncharacterized protein n=1 Tax=Babjeviella inositovora NRRL Y-12698 TaxID=984486 RepID=A0A1E3QLN2_9ASCO|nr:uncharacterized protein BABINDRAFT_9873 [Babjeviella inositovora NRRL Y-12698]ODQ77897.1 hypothetical protein BABINDRAFT_9873 [Babjeviella inositovora NRRL Y-12698]
MSGTTTSTAARPASIASPPLPTSQLTYTILAKQTFPQSTSPRLSFSSNRSPTITTTSSGAPILPYQSQPLKKTISTQAENGSLHSGSGRSIASAIVVSDGVSTGPVLTGACSPGYSKKVAYNYPVTSQPLHSMAKAMERPITNSAPTQSSNPTQTSEKHTIQSSKSPVSTYKPLQPFSQSQKLHGLSQTPFATPQISPNPVSILNKVSNVAIRPNPKAGSKKTNPKKAQAPVQPATPTDQELKQTLLVKIKENENLKKLIDNMKVEITKLKTVQRVQYSKYPVNADTTALAVGVDPGSIKMGRAQSISNHLPDHQYPHLHSNPARSPASFSEDGSDEDGSEEDLAAGYRSLIGERDLLPSPVVSSMDTHVLPPSSWLDAESYGDSSFEVDYSVDDLRLKRSKTSSSASSLMTVTGLMRKSLVSTQESTLSGKTFKRFSMKRTGTEPLYVSERKIFEQCGFCDVDSPCLCLEAELEMEDLLSGGQGGKLLGVTIRKCERLDLWDSARVKIELSGFSPGADFDSDVTME